MWPAYKQYLQLRFRSAKDYETIETTKAAKQTCEDDAFRKAFPPYIEAGEIRNAEKTRLKLNQCDNVPSAEDKFKTKAKCKIPELEQELDKLTKSEQVAEEEKKQLKDTHSKAWFWEKEKVNEQLNAKTQHVTELQNEIKQQSEYINMLRETLKKLGAAEGAPAGADCNDEYTTQAVDAALLKLKKEKADCETYRKLRKCDDEAREVLLRVKRNNSVDRATHY